MASRSHKDVEPLCPPGPRAASSHPRQIQRSAGRGPDPERAVAWTHASMRCATAPRRGGPHAPVLTFRPGHRSSVLRYTGPVPSAALDRAVSVANVSTMRLPVRQAQRTVNGGVAFYAATTRRVAAISPSRSTSQPAAANVRGRRRGRRVRGRAPLTKPIEPSRTPSRSLSQPPATPRLWPQPARPLNACWSQPDVTCPRRPACDARRCRAEIAVPLVATSADSRRDNSWSPARGSRRVGQAPRARPHGVVFACGTRATLEPPREVGSRSAVRSSSAHSLTGYAVAASPSRRNVSSMPGGLWWRGVRHPGRSAELMANTRRSTCLGTPAPPAFREARCGTPTRDLTGPTDTSKQRRAARTVRDRARGGPLFLPLRFEDEACADAVRSAAHPLSSGFSVKIPSRDREHGPHVEGGAAISRVTEIWRSSAAYASNRNDFERSDTSLSGPCSRRPIGDLR